MGDWTIWGDSTEPVAENLDYDTMKAMIDADESGELYGEQDETGTVYEG